MQDIGLISIIMAAYNAEGTIEQAIDSVLKQSYQNWELIVVNDYSTDNTAALISRYQDPRIRKFDNLNNMGVSLTRLRALQESRGEWIAILDSDDAWTADKLEKQLGLIKDKGVELVYTGSAFMDEIGKTIGWRLHVPGTLTYQELLKQNLISNSSVLVNKELYQRFFVVGDEMHEDYAIWLGITNSGYIAYGIDEPLLIYRITKSSKSGNKLKSAKMQWNTYRHIGLNLIVSAYYMCWYTVKGLIKYRHLQ